MVNIGLVGFGLSGEIFHAPFITTVDGLKLTAVVSTNPAKVLNTYPWVKVAPNLDRLLEETEINVVVITTPTNTHYDLARKAILAGKHVVVEKPFTVTTAEADDLIELANQQGVLLTVYQNRRWDNDFLTISKLVHSGVLGEISVYEAHYDRYRPMVQDRWKESATPGAGSLYDLGAHVIDQALTLFGLPESVYADLQKQRQNARSCDYFHLIIGYPRHSVILHSSSLVSTPGPHFQVHGTLGSFIKHGYDPQENALRDGKLPTDPGWGEDSAETYGTLTIMDGKNRAESEKIKTIPGGYQEFYKLLLDAVTGKGELPIKPEDSRNVIRIIELAEESHKQQRTVLV